MKKGLVLFICFMFISMPAFAVRGVKFIVESCCDFNPKEVVATNLTFKTESEVQFDSDLIIPENSLITAKFISSKSERRFHKSGFFTCKLVKYTKDGQDVYVKNRNMKMIGKRYDKVDGVEAAETGAEFTATTVAGFLLPGVDIAYYFIKGAIQNTKADTRFKSGVHNAYDNSIMWIFLKGKPIVFAKGDSLSILMCEDDKSVSDKELEKLCQ